MTNTNETPDLNAELGRLRNVNADLLDKKRTLKAKVAELEAANTELKASSEAAQQTVQRAFVDAPLDKLVNEMGVVPELLKEQLLKRYKFRLNDKQEIEIRKADDSIVLDKHGKALPLTYDAVEDLLVGDEAKKDDEASYRTFAHLVIGTRASGSGAVGSSHAPSFSASQPNAEKKAAPAFGLGLR